MSAICWEESLTKGENYWRKCFWTKEGETRCKFKPRLALISIWTWNGPLRSTCWGQRLNWYDIAGCDNNIVQMIASLGGEIDALTLSSLSVPCQRTWFNFSAIITSKLWGSKAAFTIVFFAAFDHNFDYKQQILKHRNAQNGFKLTNHNSQTKTFWTPWSTLLFPKRSAKMIDGSK